MEYPRKRLGAADLLPRQRRVRRHRRRQALRLAVVDAAWGIGITATAGLVLLFFLAAR